jgi:hypothetical protein
MIAVERGRSLRVRRSDRFATMIVDPYAIAAVTCALALSIALTVGAHVAGLTALVALLAGWASAWSP